VFIYGKEPDVFLFALTETERQWQGGVAMPRHSNGRCSLGRCETFQRKTLSMTSLRHPTSLLSRMLLSCLALAGPLTVACSKTEKPASKGSPAVQVVPVDGAVTDTRFVTMDHMIAAVEMQLSGEPLAESMGRVLTGYSRDYRPANIYFDPSPSAKGPWTDLIGFSTAVESYEYSKQPMNNLAFESGAGVSLAFGPLLNPMGLTGDDALNLLKGEVQRFAAGSHATKIVSFDLAPLTNPKSPKNLLGWPGLWPTLHPYRSFDPAIQPTSDVSWYCSTGSDDDPGEAGALLNADYECDYNTLHLPNRSQQVEFVITPGASGWAGWKYSLWTINYLQIMHDEDGIGIASVAPADAPAVGTPGNKIMGAPSQAGSKVKPGVYIGSSHIEGFQAALMIDELDNQAQQWLTSLTTTQGSTLSGFSSIADALHYDFAAPLRWIPAEIAVDEVADASLYPRPSAYRVQSSDSRLLDLSGLLGAYAEMYALTDHANVDVGGSQTTRVYFDGDPFPDDNQLPDGEATLHDRSLAMMRFLIVTLDRLHRDPASGYLSDQVSFSNGVPTRGSTVDAASVTYSLVALRTARRTLNSQLSLYSNTTPDTAVEHTPLDDVPFTGAPGNATFAQRLNALIDGQAALLFDHLTTPDGHAFSGWDIGQGQPTPGGDLLDAHTAAIRGLLTAYLATGNTRYRTRAIDVFNRMDRDFYDPATRLYNTSPAPVDEVSFTPRRFGLLQGALRDVYELVAVQPGQQLMATMLEGRIMRLNKLVLNGWDDRNDDSVVDWPGECVLVKNGLPRGGLQMAERALSGETGSEDDRVSAATRRVPTSDRDKDCVPEIDDAQLPAALANEFRLKARR
jgi:hypothetical protein